MRRYERCRPASSWRAAPTSGSRPPQEGPRRGHPDGRTVSIGKPVVTNLRKATTQTVLVTTLKHGVRNQTEFPSDGMDVAVSRVVRDRNGNVMHRETYTSAYTLWNGRIEIGR